MGGSMFVFIESKSLEFVVEDGGSFFLLHIYEQGWISLRFVCMGKESAMRILTHIEDLVSKQSSSQFARTIREGDKVFILQLGSNAHGSFLMISKLHKADIISRKITLCSENNEVKPMYVHEQ